VEDAHKDATELLRAHRDQLRVAPQALLKAETLDMIGRLHRRGLPPRCRARAKRGRVGDRVSSAPAMPPTGEIVPRYVAEPPQVDPARSLRRPLAREFLDAVQRLDGSANPASCPSSPDRSGTAIHTCRSPAASADGSRGLRVRDVLGFPPTAPSRPTSLPTRTTHDETPIPTPIGKIDLCDEVIGGWRGVTRRQRLDDLVWGRPRRAAASRRRARRAHRRRVRAVRGPLHACSAPERLRRQLLEIALTTAGSELARESLYEDDAKA